MRAAWYRIEHQTRYVHGSQVSMSQHVACLTPRRHDRQTVHEYALEVEPQPADCVERTDYYGNTATQFSILRPYTELRVRAVSLVEVRASELPTDPDNVNRDDLVFADGAIHFVNTGLTFSFTIDPRTCIGKVSGTQSIAVVGGTGRFAHAMGAGRA